MSHRPSRRRVLRIAGASATAGLVGCLGGTPDDEETEPDSDETEPDGDETDSTPVCADAGIGVETPDGTVHCVTPVESDQSIESYYGFDPDGAESATTPDDLSVDDATVLFVYRDTTTSDRSLAVINGNNAVSSDGGGESVLTFEGVTGSEWLVQDGPPGNDAYGSGDGPIDGPESVIWSWPDNRSDGGAIGPLDEGFDITATHRQSHTVGDSSGERSGLDRWLFLDGDDPEKPVELAGFDEDTGDVSVRLFTPDGDA